MTMPARTAKIVEELVDYDGPQLLALKTDRMRQMLAVAVRREGMREPFFGPEVTDKVYESYFDETADLHYAFRRAIGDKYYFFDLAAAKDDSVNLVPAAPGDATNPDLWPQSGIFARSHTTPFNREKITGAIKTFKIDGKWRTNDFSHFHTKMADLYGFFGVIGRLGGTDSTTERAFIRTTIRDRFWRGGGSYVGFYDSLVARNKLLKLAPLDVAKIKYASPGEIELRGNKKALTDVGDVVQVFDENWRALAEKYRRIHRALRREKLLRARPTASFSSASAQKFVCTETDEFAQAMRLDRVSDIFDACDHNVLVYAKVILSIYRRASELYAFHAEGRVQAVG